MNEREYGSAMTAKYDGCPSVTQPAPDPLLDRFRSLVEVAHAAVAQADRIRDAVNRGPTPSEEAAENNKPYLAGLENICDALQLAIYGIGERLAAIEEKLGK